MRNTEITGVYKDKKQIYTENLAKGKKVYNERIIKQKNKEYRSWNPYRSKLAAAILNNLNLELKNDSNVLYLGAATGTTASHISDILTKGKIIAVENSPIAMKKLLNICKTRKNIIPAFQNANHPEKYSSITPQVDLVYQDISQRNQAEIFIQNTRRYLKKDGIGILMIKARSIDVALKPKKVYEMVCSELEENKMKITKTVDLSPFQKDHAAIIIKNI